MSHKPWATLVSPILTLTDTKAAYYSSHGTLMKAFATMHPPLGWSNEIPNCSCHLPSWSHDISNAASLDSSIFIHSFLLSQQKPRNRLSSLSAKQKSSIFTYISLQHKAIGSVDKLFPSQWWLFTFPKGLYPPKILVFSKGVYIQIALGYISA